jgi:hypothetical protein
MTLGKYTERMMDIIFLLKSRIKQIQKSDAKHARKL